MQEERKVEFVATFGAADSNQDGLLDKAEFTDMMEKLAQNAGARGCPHMNVADVDEESKEAIWAFFNGQTEGTDGVSAMDFGVAAMAIAAKTREMRGN